MMQQDIEGPGELFAAKEQVINEKLSSVFYKFLVVISYS